MVYLDELLFRLLNVLSSEHRLLWSRASEMVMGYFDKRYFRANFEVYGLQRVVVNIRKFLVPHNIRFRQTYARVYVIP